MNKILTLIIPSYNMENYLDKCLDSLRCPGLDRMEVIVVNDGSKDSTLSIARSRENEYPSSIRVLDKPNGNYGSCINAALPMATGRFVKVLDADDSFCTNNITPFIDFLEKCNADLVISDYDIVDEKGSVTEEVRFNLPAGEKLDAEIILPTLRECLFEMHAVAYRREMLLEIGYRQTEGVSYTDQEWMFAPMVAVKSCRYYPHTIYRYLVGRAGQTVDAEVARRKVGETITVLNSMLDTLRERQKEISSIRRQYFDSRIMTKLVSVYRILLLKSKGEELNGALLSLDKRIADEQPSYFSTLGRETVKFIPFRFINYWRNRRDKGCFQMLRLFQTVIFHLI